jgi:hypothetical protein
MFDPIPASAAPVAEGLGPSQRLTAELPLPPELYPASGKGSPVVVWGAGAGGAAGVSASRLATSITARGFAAIENVLYIYRNGFQDGGWEGFWTLVFIRVVLVGWMHPFFTAFTGIGLAISRISRNTFIKLIAIPAGYTAAVLTHAFHNTFSSVIGGGGGFILGLIADYFGYAFMLGFIIWMITHERNILKKQLIEEMNSGAITRGQYNTAISFFQTGVHLSAITSGTFRSTSRFYQVLGELAHKKDQLQRLGDEGRNTQLIEQLRMEMNQLAPQAKV